MAVRVRADWEWQEFRCDFLDRVPLRERRLAGEQGYGRARAAQGDRPVAPRSMASRLRLRDELRIRRIVIPGPPSATGEPFQAPLALPGLANAMLASRLGTFCPAANMRCGRRLRGTDGAGGHIGRALGQRAHTRLRGRAAPGDLSWCERCRRA